MTPDQREIDKVVNDCHAQINKGGSKYPGMSYEQGITEAIAWLQGDSDQNPYAEDD